MFRLSSAGVRCMRSVSLKRFGMILVALCCLLSASCRHSEEGFRILPFNKFTKVLTDVYLTEAMLSQMDAAKKVEWIRGVQPKYFQDVTYRWILDKYHITEDEFYASVSYYSGNGHDMIEVLDKVEERLNELKSENEELMAIANKEEEQRKFEQAWKTVNIDPRLSILCAEMTRLDSLYEVELSKTPRAKRDARVLALEKVLQKNFSEQQLNLNFTDDTLKVESGDKTTRCYRYFNRRIDALEQQYQALADFRKKDTTGIVPDSLLLDWKELADIMEPLEAGRWTVLTDSVWFRMLCDTSWTQSDFCLKGGLCSCGEECQCKDSCGCVKGASSVAVEYQSAYVAWDNELDHLWRMAIQTREAIQKERDKHHYPSEIFKEVIPDSEEPGMTKTQLRKAKRQEAKLQKALAKTLEEAAAEQSEKDNQTPKRARKEKRGKQVSRKMVVPADPSQEESVSE